MLLLFGLIYADGAGGTADSFNFMAPSILIGAALFFSCLGGPIATLVAERERNTLKRLLLSPMGGTAYFLGVTLAHLAIGVGQVVIVYGIAFAFGGRFLGSVFLGALIVGLSVTSYVGLGFFFGSRFAKRTEDVNGPVAAIGVPLLVLGGTFFPPSMLPPYLLTLAHLNPIFHMNEALDPVSAEGLGWAAVQDHMIFLLVFASLSVVLGARSYQRMLERERVL
jgi:ABC-2 type transport system permease protein